MLFSGAYFVAGLDPPTEGLHDYSQSLIERTIVVILDGRFRETWTETRFNTGLD